MPESGSERRNSRALEPPLIADPKARAATEARNGLRQYDAGIKTVQTALERGTFKLRPSLVLALHREALADISSYAGNYRPAGVRIESSRHEPVGAHLVPELIEDMCDYVNDRWEVSTPLHLAAYIMWRFRGLVPSFVLRWHRRTADRGGIAEGALRATILMSLGAIAATAAAP